jgi:hypothetical protein
VSAITEQTALRTIEQCAEFAGGMCPKKLRAVIRSGRGTPTMTNPRRDVWLVVWSEFVEWLNRRRVSGAEVDSQVAACRPARSEAARRRLVRVADQRPGTSESC